RRALLSGSHHRPGRVCHRGHGVYHPRHAAGARDVQQVRWPGRALLCVQPLRRRLLHARAPRRSRHLRGRGAGLRGRSRVRAGGLRDVRWGGAPVLQRSLLGAADHLCGGGGAGRALPRLRGAGAPLLLRSTGVRRLPGAARLPGRAVPGALSRAACALLLLGCARKGPPPVCDGVTGLAVTRIAEHPGGGDEVTARLRFAGGVPIAEADLVECLSVEGKSAAIARRPIDLAFTLLLVDPGRNQAAAENARNLVQAIVKKRPAGEPVAVFRWGTAVTQVAPMSGDRRVLLERLAVGLAPSDALAAAAAVLDQAGGPAVDAQRSIVLVGPRAAATAGLAAALGRAGSH